MSNDPQRLEATVRELEQELIACQRLAMLGNLAAMAAHEFRNLMTPIVARCEAALTTDDAAFTRKAVERALTQAQRAIAVTGHLLDYAHDTAKPVETCSVAEAVREAIETQTRPLEKDGIQLTVAVPAELQVRAQPDLFCQVLLNLLVNARQAMKDMRAALTVSAQQEGAHVAIRVRDSGRGFPREKLDNVLNPFLAAEPTDRVSDWHDVGLGLSVCRMIARRHQATIHAEANEGPGCTFVLRWPSA